MILFLFATSYCTSSMETSHSSKDTKISKMSKICPRKRRPISSRRSSKGSRSLRTSWPQNSYAKAQRPRSLGLSWRTSSSSISKRLLTMISLDFSLLKESWTWTRLHPRSSTGTKTLLTTPMRSTAIYKSPKKATKKTSLWLGRKMQPWNKLTKKRSNNQRTRSSTFRGTSPVAQTFHPTCRERWVRTEVTNSNITQIKKLCKRKLSSSLLERL